MKNRRLCIIVGMILYVGISLTDRFLIPVDDIIYISVTIVSILSMLIGILKKEN